MADRHLVSGIDRADMSASAVRAHDGASSTALSFERGTALPPMCVKCEVRPAKRSPKGDGSYHPLCNGCKWTPEEARKRKNDRRNTLRERCVNEKRCTSCGKNPIAVTSSCLCQGCLDKIKNSNRKREINDPKTREKIRQKNKRNYYRRARGETNKDWNSEIHIDHIIPYAYLFKAIPDIDKASEIANQEWNLRRIPAKDNMRKLNKMTDEAWELCHKHGIPIIAWKSE